MGKKKIPFIDKKNSTKWTLTYGGQHEDGEQDTASISRGSESRYGYEDELSAYGSESQYGYDYENYGGYVISETRRKEIIALGFPDDGYDYIAHLKDLGPKTRKPSSGRRGAQKSLPSTSNSSGDTATDALTAPPLIGILEGQEEQGGEEGEGEEKACDEDDENEAAGGPSVFIAGTFVPPEEDIKLLDARQLVVHGKAQDDSEADKAAPSVSAFARVHNAKPQRGRLMHDLVEIEETMASVENKHEEGLLNHVKEAAESSSVKQFISHIANDGEEDGDWDEWFDDFVVAAAKDEPGIPEETENEEEDLEEEHEGSVDGDDREEGAASLDAGKTQEGSSRGEPAKPGVRAASIASSYWRPEREDRKGELSGLDDRFEKLATQYEDEALGELEEEEEAAKARNNANISDFAGMLDEFLLEQAEMEAQQDDLLLRRQAAAAGGRSGGKTAASKAEARVLAELGGDDGIEDYIGGEEYDDVHGLGGSDDEGKAGPSRLGHQSRDRLGASSSATEALAGPVPIYRKVQALDEIDPEVISKTRERIAMAEAEAMKRLEKQEAEGKAPTPYGDDEEGIRPDTGLLGEAGDLFNEVLVKRVVEQDDRWDCESVLSLRSNLENHPARIAEPQRRAGARGGEAIKLSSKTGMPAGYVSSSAAAAKGGAAGPGLHKLEEGDDEGQSGDSASDLSDGGHLEGEGDGNFGICLERRKDETPEEKRARKAAVKEAKREARSSKKALKTMFREEGAKQRRQAAGSRSAGVPSGGSTFVIA